MAHANKPVAYLQSLIELIVAEANKCPSTSNAVCILPLNKIIFFIVCAILCTYSTTMLQFKLRLNPWENMC
jgi:hypothetical protein